MFRKGLFIVLDGLGDRPQASLDGRTPLEAARTPHFDRLVSAGLGGLVDPLRPGVPVDTHTGFGLLMGLPPDAVPGFSRGPVEAAGVGLSVNPGEVALRCNFATLEPDGARWRILDRRAGRIQDGTKELARELAEIDLGDGVRAQFRAATQHRAVLLLSGTGLSAEVTDTDPGSGAEPSFVLPCRAARPDDPAALRTASAVERFLHEARERLAAHPINGALSARGELPANGLLTRGAGVFHEVRSLVNELGLRAAMITGERTALGLAALFGFTAKLDARFTALPDTDLEAKAQAAREALETHDLVYLHVKGTDICSHDLDPCGKRDLLERIDAAFADLLEPAEIAIAVGADHSTDSSRGDHCGDPVPSMLYVPHGRRDDVSTFGESTCATGGLGRLRGSEFLLCLIDGMNAMSTYGSPDHHGFGLA